MVKWLSKMIQESGIGLLTPLTKGVTIERSEGWRLSFRPFTKNRMNTVVAPFTAFLPDAKPAGIDVVQNTGASPVQLDELIHELRQPLGVIESLTFFIELTTTDDKIRPRLEQIQSMLTKVHLMLEDANEKGMSAWPAHVRHSRR